MHELRELAALMNAGRYEDAEIASRNLIRRSPRLGSAWKLCGAALSLQGKDPVRALETACQLLPDDAQVQWQLGQALHERRDFAGAAMSHGRALSIDPGLPEAHDGMGLALQGLGRLNEAVASYRKALELRPVYAEALGNLGNALSASGEHEAAAESYRAMISIEPRIAAAHHNLGDALRSLGKSAQSELSYRRALMLDPNASDTLANLSLALRDLGRSEEAVACCRRALEIEPKSVAAYHYLGNALFDLGEFDEAAVCYRRALSLAPHSAENHAAAGMLARQLGQTAEAGDACRRALTIKPDSAETMALLGEICADIGDFPAAEEQFRRALSIDPDLPEAWAGLARYRKIGAADVLWRESVQRILDKKLPLHHQIILHFALGKYFDDLQDFEIAFHHYRLANELSRSKRVKHDQQRLTQQVDRTTALYDVGWLERARAESNPSPRAVFVVGLPRAGTTLAEQILASHPNAFGVGELRFWHSAAAHCEKSGVGGMLEQGAVARMAGHYLSLLSGLSADTLRVIDKMPANFMNLGLIHAALPNARIIHMRRDPRDTGLSIYFQNFSATHSYAHELRDIAHYYAQYERLMAHWRALLPKGAILDMEYERLVDDPESACRAMLDFVGLPWNPRCLDFHLTNRTVTTASNWQVRQKINRDSVGRWRNYQKYLGPLQQLVGLQS